MSINRTLFVIDILIKHIQNETVSPPYYPPLSFYLANSYIIS